jgi:hypothetical protein
MTKPVKLGLQSAETEGKLSIIEDIFASLEDTGTGGVKLTAGPDPP